MVKVGYKLISLFGIFMSFLCIFMAMFIAELPVSVKIILPVFSGFFLYLSGKLWYTEKPEYGW